MPGSEATGSCSPVTCAPMTPGTCGRPPTSSATSRATRARAGFCGCSPCSGELTRGSQERMTHTLAVLLLVLCCIIGLVLVPLGLPGLWVMVGGVLGYGALTEFRTVGIATMAVVLGLAFLGE